MTLQRVLDEGELKENRTGTDTLVIPTVMLTHNMSEGFPLLTTKKMYTRGISVELEGFIQGITDKYWYQERKCNIWNGWCNPELLDQMQLFGDLRKETQQLEQDLGPIYGYQWRRYNETYHNGEYINEGLPPLEDPCDQLNYIIRTLQENPNDRRMLCFAWNPLQKSQQALPACHLGFNIQHINGKLHLTWFQRSCDMFLGVPFNIASYALLLELIAKHVGMEAGTLNGVLCDTHVYVNHIEQCKEQISRSQFGLPKLKLPDEVNIFEWTHEDMEIVGYQSHGSIKGDVAI